MKDDDGEDEEERRIQKSYERTQTNEGIRQQFQFGEQFNLVNNNHMNEQIK